MNEIALENLLSDDAFWRVNKRLGRALGLVEAILLSDLMSKRKYWRGRNMLDEQGGFFNFADEIQSDLAISRTTRHRILQNLQKSDVLVIKKRGVPAKNYYYIQDQKILNILRLQEILHSSVQENTPTSGTENLPTINKKKEQEKVIRNNDGKPSVYKQVCSEIGEQYKALYFEDLPWDGNATKYGKAIKTILSLSGNDIERVRSKICLMADRIRAKQFVKGGTFNPLTLLSNWDSLVEVKQIASGPVKISVGDAKW